MHRFLPFVIALVLLTGSWFLPDAQAQILKGSKSDDGKPGRAPPVAPYAFAIVSTLAVLTIVCYPTRKG